MKRSLLKDGKVLFEYKGGWIIWHPWDGFVRTHFNLDQTDCMSMPNYRDEDKQMAAELGYEDVKEMSRDHEILHTFLSEKNGLEVSPTLRGVAAQKDFIPVWMQLEEEAVVLGFQRFLNKGIIDNYLRAWLDRTNLNVEDLKNEYAELKGIPDTK